MGTESAGREAASGLAGEDVGIDFGDPPGRMRKQKRPPPPPQCDSQTPTSPLYVWADEAVRSPNGPLT